MDIAKLSFTFTSNFSLSWLRINFIKSSTHQPTTTTHSPGLVVKSNYNINFNFIDNSN